MPTFRRGYFFPADDAEKGGLGEDESDMLRDAFIAIDSDGDGLVSKEQLLGVITELQGATRAGSFQPYLSSIFQTADKDCDGLLSLPEFFGCFVDGVGILPHNVLLDCVSHVQIRVSDSELSVLQNTFGRIDKDEDGLISTFELASALEELWLRTEGGEDPSASMEIAQGIIEKIDRDGDGMLNLSEFILSFQTDQQVFPLGLLEQKPVGILESFNDEERAAFVAALEATCSELGCAAHYFNEGLVFNTLVSALSVQNRWERGDIDAIIDATFLLGLRDPLFEYTICIRPIVEEFCSEEDCRRLCEDISSSNVPVAVTACENEEQILAVVFRYLDADFDGYIAFDDLYALQRASLYPSEEEGEHLVECHSAFLRDVQGSEMVDLHAFIGAFVSNTDGSGFGISFDTVKSFASTIRVDLPRESKRALAVAFRSAIQQAEQSGARPTIAIQDFREFVFGACEWCSQDSIVPTPKELLSVFEPIAREWSHESVFNPYVVAKALNVSLTAEVSRQNSSDNTTPPAAELVVVPEDTQLLPPVMLTPYEYSQLCDTISSLASAKSSSEEDLQAALKEILVGEGKNSLSELEQWQRLGALFSRIVALPGWPQLPKLASDIASNPSCLAIGVDVDPAGDVKALEVLESCGLESSVLRELVRKLAALDDVRDGVIDLKEAALLIRQAVSQGHPSWSERQVQRVIKTIFNAGFLNEASRSLTFTRVILQLASKHFIVPEKHLEQHASALSRRLDQHDIAGICSVIECLDGIPGENQRSVFLNALVQRSIVSDSSSIQSILTCVIDYLRTFSVTPVVLAERLRGNPAVLVFPLMKAQDCQEVCARKLSVLLPYTVLQRISRTLLLLDKRGDGLILKAELVPILRDALISMLQVTDDANVAIEGVSVLTAETEELRFCTNISVTGYVSPIPALPSVQCAEELEGFVAEIIRLVVLSQPEVPLPQDYYSAGGVRGLGGRPGPATTGLQMSHFIDYLIASVPGTLIPPGYLPSVACRFKTPINFGQEEILSQTLKMVLTDRGGVVTPDELITILSTALDAPSRQTDVARIAEMLLQVGEGPLGSHYDLRFILPTVVVDSAAVTLELSRMSSGRAAAQAALKLTRLEKVRRIAQAFLRLDDGTKDGALDEDEIIKSLMDDIERLAGVADVKLRRQMAKLRFTELDSDKDGLLCFEEFLSSFSQGPSAPLGAVRPALSTVELDIVLNRATSRLAIHAPPTPSSPVRDHKGGALVAASTGDAAESPSRQRFLCPRNISNVAVFGDELQADFEMYDTNGNGYLEYNEFRQAYRKMENYGITPSESEVESVFMSVCRDRSRVTFEEFCILMLRRSKM